MVLFNKNGKLPSADDLSLGGLGDTDISVGGELVEHEARASGNGNSQDDHDGVSGRIGKPNLLGFSRDESALGTSLGECAGTVGNGPSKRVSQKTGTKASSAAKVRWSCLAMN